jgi:hypothetical protein
MLIVFAFSQTGSFLVTIFKKVIKKTTYCNEVIVGIIITDNREYTHHLKTPNAE